jgi:predicted MFS family arabinose efflux permease
MMQSGIIKTRLYSLLIIIPFLMVFLALGFILLGKSVFLVFILMSLWKLFATSAPIAWWTWLSKVLLNDAKAGDGLMVAIIQLAITLSAAIDGLFFDSLRV